MGVDVCAFDILKNNIKIINKFKKFYNLNNLRLKIHDFINEFKGVNIFDFTTCHNWIQHTPNSSGVFYKLVKNICILICFIKAGIIFQKIQITVFARLNKK